MRYFIATGFLFCFGFLHAQTTRYKEFYKDGKLLAIKHQGFFNGCGMAVGTDSFFYRSGESAKTVFFANRESKTSEGCHEGFTVEVTKTFFRSGALKTKSQIKRGYETESCNCGQWLWYNEKGKVIQRKKNISCENEVLCD